LQDHSGARSGGGAEIAESAATTSAARTATASAAPAATSNRGRRRRRIAGFERRGVDGHGVGRDVLPLAAVDGAGRGAASSTTAAAKSAAAGARDGSGIEHGILVEVDRQILAIIAVGDGALQVAEHAAQNGSAREQLGGMLHGDAASQVVLGQQGGGGPFGDQSPTLLDEFRQLLQAFQAHAAANIVGLVHAAQIGRPGGLLVGDGRGAGHGDAVDHGGGGAAHVGEDDHVV